MSRALRKALAAASSAAAVTLVLASCSDPLQPTASPAGPSLAKSASAQDEDAVVPGEILVSFREGVDASTKIRARGLVRKALGYGGSFNVVSVNAGQERALANVFKNDPDVEWAEPNYIRTVEVIDTTLWAFHNPGGLNMKFSDGSGPIPASYASKADADEDAIEGIAVGGGAVVIGNIDTGVDITHPEFAGRLYVDAAGRHGCDWYDQAAKGNGSGTCSDFTPYDTPDQGHGTHTAGTMGGAKVGVAGVTGANVKIHVQRVCGPVGCYTSSIINAIRAAADVPGMVAMNLSLGGRTESAGEKSAISYAVNTKKVLVIAAAGNSGTNKVACPACDPYAISVSATTWQDQLAAYSQYGSGLDISAPGGYCYSNTTEEGCIFSAVVAGYQATQGYREYDGPLAGGKYAYMNGTSMATPQVTGTAGVVASVTGLRGAALRTRLESTADDKGTAGYDTKFGNGRLNTYRAVKGTSTSPY